MVALVRKFSNGGDLFNILDSNVRYPAPSVGDPATILHYSDRTPGTVVEVTQKGSTVLVSVQVDNAVRIDKNGISESQIYEYERNPKGSVYVYRRNKSGLWAPVMWKAETKRWINSGGAGVRFGSREAYIDPTF